MSRRHIVIANVVPETKEKLKDIAKNKYGLTISGYLKRVIKDTLDRENYNKFNP